MDDDKDDNNDNNYSTFSLSFSYTETHTDTRKETYRHAHMAPTHEHMLPYAALSLAHAGRYKVTLQLQGGLEVRCEHS